jgi:hypothetical protein
MVIGQFVVFCNIETSSHYLPSWRVVVATIIEKEDDQQREKQECGT